MAKFPFPTDSCNSISRKAQISIFMILALLIILGGVVFFYLQDEEQKAGISATTTEAASTIPLEFSPVKSFVEGCLMQASEEALVAVGEQGGYASIASPKRGIEPFRISTQPTESDAITLGGITPPQTAIPYWRYLKSANSCTGTCELSSRRPPLSNSPQSIEQQLSDYSSEWIIECLDFSAFSEQGFHIEMLGAPKISAKIGEQDVQFTLSYPLRMSRNSATHEANTFVIVQDVRLKQLYDLATHLTNLEMQYGFLERHVLNLIVAFSGLTRDKIPPMSEVRFKFGETLSWSKRDVQNKITGFLSGYTQLFQVVGTSNFDRNTFGDDLLQKLYDSTLIPNLPGTQFNGIDAEFTYLDSWPIYFDLNCDGDVCKPSSVNSLLSIIGLQTYNFAYDLSFPVLVELRDTTALNGRGYTFRFGLEANIRNNEVMKSNFAPLELASFEEASLLCSEESRTSANITIKVTDGSKLPIQGANVLYTLLDSSCFIGTTGEEGRLVAQFPGGVVGGALTVVSEHAVQKSIDYTPTSTPETVTIALSPIATKKIMVLKKQLLKSGNSWSFKDSAEDLSQDEQALVTLRRIPGEGEQELLAVAQVDSKNPFGEVKLAPGTYEADVRLLLKKPVKILAQTTCSKPSFFSPEVCYTIPEVDFSKGEAEPQFQGGGFLANITLTAQNLAAADTLVLYVVAVDLPSTIDDLNVAQDVDGLSQTYLVALQPTFTSTTTIT